MSYSVATQLSRDRCWICGYRKLTEVEIRSLPYLCYWCSPGEAREIDRLTIRELIGDLTNETEEHLRQGGYQAAKTSTLFL